MEYTKETFKKVKQGLEIIEKENALSEKDKCYLEAMNDYENLILFGVGKCLNEVYKDLDKSKEHFRVKNWYR